jgi:hypothetical protein
MEGFVQKSSFLRLFQKKAALMRQNGFDAQQNELLTRKGQYF